jgi:hypothetical protein
MEGHVTAIGPDVVALASAGERPDEDVDERATPHSLPPVAAA